MSTRRDSERPSDRLRNFVDQPLFKFLLDLEVPKAIRLQYCFSVVCLTLDSLPGESGSSLTEQLAETALHQLRATDSVTTLSPSSIGLLLIDAELSALPRILDRLKEELAAHPLMVEGREWRLSWSAGGGCYPRTSSSGRELLRQALELMTRAKEEGGNRLYLPS